LQESLRIKLTLMRLVAVAGTVACRRIHLAVQPTHKPHPCYQTVYPSNRITLYTHAGVFTRARARTHPSEHPLHTISHVTTFLTTYQPLPTHTGWLLLCDVRPYCRGRKLTAHKKNHPLDKGTDLLSGSPECLVNLL